MKVIDFILKFAAKGDNTVINAASNIQAKLEAADSAAVRLTRSVGGGLKDAFMSLPGAEFITNPIVTMTAGIGTVASLGMQAEKTAKSFDVLVGSSEKSSKMLDEINSYADNTLWSRMDMSEAAQSLLAYSIPAEKVVDDLKMLGDISLGDKNKMSTLASVFGQISTAGKLMTQDYKQLLNVGFNPLQDMMQTTGKSMAELQDDMSKGKISFEMFEQAVAHATGEGGKYNGMIESLAGTTSGKFEQMKGAFTATLLEIYELIQPLVATVLSGVNKVLAVVQSIIPYISMLTPIIASITAAVVAYNAVQLIANGLLNGFTITEGIHYMWLLLVEKAQWLLNAAMNANPIGIVIALISALVAGIVVCWNKFAGFRAVILTVWDTVKGFGEILKNFVIDRIKGIISGLGFLGQAIGKLFKGDFSGAWESASQGFKELSGYDAVRNTVTSTKGLVNGIGDNYSSHLAEEQDAQSGNGISAPGVPGTATIPELGENAYGGGGGKSGGSNADSITTGGSRSTNITMTVTKFFDNMNITMESAKDTDELQNRIVECMNRALEVALSAAR